MYGRKKKCRPGKQDMKLGHVQTYFEGGMLYRSSRSSCRLKVFHIAGIDFRMNRKKIFPPALPS